jgi:hypothetical protein
MFATPLTSQYLYSMELNRLLKTHRHRILINNSLNDCLRLLILMLYFNGKTVDKNEMLTRMTNR